MHRNLGSLLFFILVISCNSSDCNYNKLTADEYAKIAELNQAAIQVDTMFNDTCLKGYFHVYLKTESSTLEIENEVKEIISALKIEQMDRDIWVFNNQDVFLYRMFHNSSGSKSSLIKTDLQYPNE